MSTTPIGRLSLWTAGILAALAGAPHASAQPFASGEILLTNYGNGVTAGKVQRYTASGSFVQSYSDGLGVNWLGAAVTPGGNLVTSHQVEYPNPNQFTASVVSFSPSGTAVGSFLTSGIAVPGGVSVFANGNVAVSGQFTNSVTIFTPSGGTVAMAPAGANPIGTYVGPDNVLAVAGYGNSTLSRIDQNGVLLGTVGLSFQPGGVAAAHDGTYWLSGVKDGRAHHVTATGADLGSFLIGLSGDFYALGLTPDDQSLYVATFDGSVVRKFNTSGVQLSEFAINTPDHPVTLTVVSPTPEPAGVLAVAAGGAWVLACAARCRRGRRSSLGCS